MPRQKVITPDPDYEEFTATELIAITESALICMIIQLNAKLQQLESVVASHSASVATQMAKLQGDINGLAGDLSDTSKAQMDQIGKLANDLASTDDNLSSSQSSDQSIRAAHFALIVDAVGGDLEMALQSGTAAEDVSAAELNAAEADSFTKTINIQLQSTSDKIQKLANFQPTITPDKGTVADADVDAPTVTWTDDRDDEGITPRFNGGLLRLTVTFDTDAGATKTYVNGEQLTVTIDVATNNILCGNVSNFVKTYNVIA